MYILNIVNYIICIPCRSAGSKKTFPRPRPPPQPPYISSFTFHLAPKRKPKFMVISMIIDRDILLVLPS